ncbi:MAG TPA: NAD(P)-dependent oxidoreductase [Gaiellaceae bacterium]
MTVFLAGATGVLGRALIPRLVVRGHRVRAIARRRPRISLPEGVELIEADLLAADLRRLVDGCDAVIHIATAIPSDPSAPGAWDDNARLRTSGTRRLLAAALACGASRYVQQSIVMAYRDGGDAWLDEQAPLDDSPARATVCGPVIEMETMIHEVEPQALAWTILRGGSFVGEGTGQRALIERLRDGTVVVAGDGSNYVSLVNVADMAVAVAAAVEAAPAGSTFNLVDDPLRYGDYVDALADLIGVPRPVRAPKLPLPPSWRCTNRAAQTVLGWIPRERIWPYRDRGLPNVQRA